MAPLTAAGTCRADGEACPTAQAAPLRLQWLVRAPSSDGAAGCAPGQHHRIVAMHSALVPAVSNAATPHQPGHFKARQIPRP